MTAATRSVELGGAGRPDAAGFSGSMAGVGWRGVGERTNRRAHVSMRGERKGTEDGRRESKKKMYSAKYARGARGPSGPMRGMIAYE
jgi:hypothetical protein